MKNLFIISLFNYNYVLPDHVSLPSSTFHSPSFVQTFPPPHLHRHLLTLADHPLHPFHVCEGLAFYSESATKTRKGMSFGQRVILQAFWRRAALWFKSLPVQLLSERNRAEQHLHERNRFYLALYMTMFWKTVTCLSKIMNIRNNWP